MLTVWNWKPSLWISKTAATPMSKEIQSFQFIFTGQQYFLIYFDFIVLTNRNNKVLKNLIKYRRWCFCKLLKAKHHSGFVTKNHISDTKQDFIVDKRAGFLLQNWLFYYVITFVWKRISDGLVLQYYLSQKTFNEVYY